MVESVNASTGVQAAAQVKSASQTQQSGKAKNIPMVENQNLTPEQKKAIENLKAQIDKGNVKFIDSNILEDILNFLFDGKSGDFIKISNFADSNKKLTFGDAKYILKLNLPPGSLKHNKTERGGGNFDRYSVPKDNNGQYYLDIFIDDLIEATGLTKDEIKKLCEQ